MFALDELCFGPPFRFTARAMQRFAGARNARVILAESDGELSGFVILHVQEQVQERSGYIVTLDVSPTCRRSGLGSELMRRAEAEAVNAACDSLLLHVFVENVTAIRFYERLGFALLGTVERFYNDAKQGEPLDALLYRKPLRPRP